MDHRLVIPKDMRENMLRTIHFGHTGRDAMLKEALDFGGLASTERLSKKPGSATIVRKPTSG